MTRIITSHVFPPIPDRRWDWCAYRDGREEDTNAYGWGPTEGAALADLERLEKEVAEYEEEMQARREGRDPRTLTELEREFDR